MSIAWALRDEILCVSAQRTLASVTEQIRAARKAWVVIRRAAYGKSFYYAYRADEILKAYAAADEERRAMSLTQALQLHEGDSSPKTRRRANAPEAPPPSPVFPARARIVEVDADGRPNSVGAVVSHQDITRIVEPLGPTRGGGGGHRTRRGFGGGLEGDEPVAERGVEEGGKHYQQGPPILGEILTSTTARSRGFDPTEASPTIESAPMTVSASAPDEVKRNDVAEVLVRVDPGTTSGLAGGAAARVEANPTEPILVFLTTHGAAVEVIGDDSLELTPPDSGASTQGVFRLKPTEAGDVRLSLHFRQARSELARLSLKFLAVEDAPSEATTTATEPVSAPSAKPPDHVDLLIDERRGDGGRIYYEYNLIASFGIRRFQSPDLLDRGHGAAASTQAYLDAIYERVLATVSTWDDLAELQRKVGVIGASMCGELFNEEFTALLWKNRDRLRTVRVISWEPLIPWELLRLRDPDSGALDDKYLCEYGLVRMLEGQIAPPRLPLRDWRYLSAGGVGAESVFFETDIKQFDVSPTPIEPTVDAVLGVLREGAFDVLHFGCHGVAEHDAIEDSRVLLARTRAADGSERDLFIEPQDVEVEAALRKRQPLVFLNACESGREGARLTRMGGWPSCFLRAGAGVFVGTSWEVRERPAAQFARVFYEKLLGGVTLAEAANAARAAIRNFDASWLAYKVYGDPDARLHEVRP